MYITIYTVCMDAEYSLLILILLSCFLPPPRRVLHFNPLDMTTSRWRRKTLPLLPLECPSAVGCTLACPSGRRRPVLYLGVVIPATLRIYHAEGHIAGAAHIVAVLPFAIHVAHPAPSLFPFGQRHKGVVTRLKAAESVYYTMRRLQDRPGRIRELKGSS